jgi:enoyl-CoA hydratase
MPARRAYELGIVNRVVPIDQLDASALEMAQRIALAPPFALKLLKKSLNRSVELQGIRHALSAHFDVHQLSHVSDEYAQTRKEGLDSAIKKAAIRS